MAPAEAGGVGFPLGLTEAFVEREDVDGGGQHTDIRPTPGKEVLRTTAVLLSYVSLCPSCYPHLSGNILPLWFFPTSRGELIPPFMLCPQTSYLVSLYHELFQERNIQQRVLNMVEQALFRTVETRVQSTAVWFSAGERDWAQLSIQSGQVGFLAKGQGGGERKGVCQEEAWGINQVLAEPTGQDSLLKAG